MSLLSGAVQPALLTLLSSTSQPVLSPLFKAVTDSSLPDDSIITVLPDTIAGASSDTRRSHPTQVFVPKHAERGQLAHPVIHIQSPNVRLTYIQAGSSASLYRYYTERHNGKQPEDIARPLGIEVPWIGLHIRRLGRRELSFEIGVIDLKGREGIIRCSTFKREPSLHPHRSIPLVHLPLCPRPHSASTLTPWLHISMDLSRLLPLFTSLPRHGSSEAGEAGPRKKRRKVGEMPSPQFGSVSYVRVYANCRVRRIWFAEDGERTLEGMDRPGKEEWGLYAANEDSDA